MARDPLELVFAEVEGDLSAADRAALAEAMKADRDVRGTVASYRAAVGSVGALAAEVPDIPADVAERLHTRLDHLFAQRPAPDRYADVTFTPARRGWWGRAVSIPASVAACALIAMVALSSGVPRPQSVWGYMSVCHRNIETGRMGLPHLGGSASGLAQYFAAHETPDIEQAPDLTHAGAALVGGHIGDAFGAAIGHRVYEYQDALVSVLFLGAAGLTPPDGGEKIESPSMPGKPAYLYRDDGHTILVEEMGGKYCVVISALDDTAVREFARLFAMGV